MFFHWLQGLGIVLGRFGTEKSSIHQADTEKKHSGPEKKGRNNKNGQGPDLSLCSSGDEAQRSTDPGQRHEVGTRRRGMEGRYG